MVSVDIIEKCRWRSTALIGAAEPGCYTCPMGRRLQSDLRTNCATFAMQQTLSWPTFSRYNDMAAGLKSTFLARSPSLYPFLF